MIPFVLGTTAVVVPQVGLPAVGLAAAVKGIQAIRKKGKGNSQTQAVALPNGSPAPVTLQWKNLTCVLTDKKHKTTKRLLQGVTGEAKPGRLLAILGPSGSGKTTLLNTLASQLPTSQSLLLTGDLQINGVPASRSNHQQAYVQQDDVFYSQLTTLETLTTAAELRLPASMSAEEKTAYVEHLMAVLGLTKVANSRVGGGKVRGLSGGERKRLSLACELISSPSLIFLDEPTSGLDAAAAEKVMLTLKSLAKAGHTVVCSIHQPRSSIWEMFDDLVLLHEGMTVYEGPADKALPYFSSLGHPCPPAHNPAEFLSDLISADYAAPSAAGEEPEAAASEQARSRIKVLLDAWQAHSLALTAIKTPGDADPAVHEGMGDPPAPIIPWHRQFKLLAQRSWRQVMRDKATFIAKIGANVTSGLLFGMIFYRMGRAQSAIQDRMGLMQVVVINTVMGSLSKTLSVFPRERQIVNRERARHSYHTAPYLAGKLLAELPVGALTPSLFGCIVYPMCGLNPKPVRFAKFIGGVTMASFASSAFGLMVGAFAPSTEVAMALGPAMMTLWIVFGGYYVSADNVPWLLKWLPKCSLIKQAFTALLINEVLGLRFEPDAQGRGMKSGQEVIDWLSLGKSSVRGATIQQARIIGFYYVAAYSILTANRPKFQPLLPPRPAKAADGVQMSALPAPPTPAPSPAPTALDTQPVAAVDEAPRVDVDAAVPVA